jgi:hypothetical protein
MKRAFLVFLVATVMIWASPVTSWCAYHHEGESDTAKFLTVYPEKAGTKLDHCALCHSGGSYEDSKGKTVTLGSCQWCHYTYGYDAHGNIMDTLNQYGLDYLNGGKSTSAIEDIEGLDSDGDGYTNILEILAIRYPGSEDDDPSKIPAPSRVYTRAQIEAMEQHTEFLLMNTSRSGDFYASYTGVPIKDLLDDAAIDLENADGIIVYAPDGWSQYHPLDYDADIEMYHVYGNATGQGYQYPPANYYYDLQADQDENPDGWCDYSSPSCEAYSNGQAIPVSGGLKAILAIKREGAYLDAGVLTDENKLDGEGPFRVVVPQKYPNAPDQSSKSSVQDVIWPYVEDWDHNAGACTRSATIIKVSPLPLGTTDIDIMEAGWAYVDANKIVIYGAIDGDDSNGNGVLDSEEIDDPSTDFDDDGTPDYQDSDTAYPRHANGGEHVLIHTSEGDLANVSVMTDDDASLSTTNRPSSIQCPYGAMRFQVTGLEAGDSVTVTLVFPENVPTSAKYYKITSAGWTEIPMGSNDGDEIITLMLTDGDPVTDTDGEADGIITDPGVLATAQEGSSSGGGDGGTCFVTMASRGSWNPLAGITLFGILLLLAGTWLKIWS